MWLAVFSIAQMLRWFNAREERWHQLYVVALGLLIGDVLAWMTIKPLEKGIDLSIVGEGMEMWGASSVLYPRLYLEDVLLANAVVLVLGFLASLSPAWRASRYEPVEAITKVG